MEKILIVFYSYEGHTAHVANSIKDLLNCSILQIKPVKEMQTKGFGKYFWGGSQVYMNKTPKLEDFEINFNQYDKIFIGSPIWAWNITPPVKSFLKENYLKDKDIYFFYTHDGGPGKVEMIFSKQLGDNRLISAKGFINQKKDIKITDLEVKKWLEDLKLT